MRCQSKGRDPMCNWPWRSACERMKEIVNDGGREDRERELDLLNDVLGRGGGEEGGLCVAQGLEQSLWCDKGMLHHLAKQLECEIDPQMLPPIIHTHTHSRVVLVVLLAHSLSTSEASQSPLLSSLSQDLPRYSVSEERQNTQRDESS